MPRFQGVWMVSSINGLPHYVPDNPDVIRSFEGRGFELTDLPVDLDSDDPEFIELLEALQAKVEKDSHSKGEAKSATKTKKEVE